MTGDIMFKTKVVGHILIGQNKLPYAVKIAGVSDLQQPFGLFEKGSNTADFPRLLKWLGTRVFPENRVDADKLLRQIGLDRYSVIGIAEKTLASTMLDNWWIRLLPEQTFYENTVRGIAISKGLILE